MSNCGNKGKIESAKTEILQMEEANAEKRDPKFHEKLLAKLQNLYCLYADSPIQEERQFATEILDRVWNITKNSYIGNKIADSFPSVDANSQKNWWEGISPLDPEVQDNCYACNCFVAY